MFCIFTGRWSVLFSRMVGGRCVSKYMVRGRWLMVGGGWFCTTPFICPPTWLQYNFIIYLQSECIEKYQVEICQNMTEKMILTSYLDKSYFVVRWGGYVASIQTMWLDKS